MERLNRNLFRKMKRRTVNDHKELNIFKLRKEGGLSGREDILHGPGASIPLTQTPCFFGGHRFWFECPQCGRRVAILYMPKSESRYLCRYCYNLTYSSCQMRRSRIESFARLFRIERKFIGIYDNAGRKGLSKVKQARLEKLMDKAK